MSDLTQAQLAEMDAAMPRPFRAVWPDGFVLHGVQFPSGRCVTDAPASGLAKAAVSLEALELHESAQIEWAAAPTSPSEPVPSIPRVPGSTERPEGILAELLRIAASPDAPPDRLLHAVDQAAPGRFGFGVHDSELVEDLCRAVVAGLVEHLGDLASEVAPTPRVWVGPGCCRAAYESDGHAHAHAHDHTGPRVWAMPEIPEDVKAVEDRAGWRWERVGELWRVPGEVDGEAFTRTVNFTWVTERDLLELRSPLTEVEETNDAG